MTYDPRNLLGGPPPTQLPEDPDARAMLDGGADPTDVAARFPAYSLAWALLAERALDGGRPVEGYAYARTGYHRGLDALRRAGWKGHGPVPWEHEPNRGFLRALHALGTAAAAIGETDEAQRCSTFLHDSSAAAFNTLGDPAQSADATGGSDPRIGGTIPCRGSARPRVDATACPARDRRNPRSVGPVSGGTAYTHPRRGRSGMADLHG